MSCAGAVPEYAKRLTIIAFVLSVLIISLCPLAVSADTPDVETETLDFANDPDTALAKLNAYKTGDTDSTWDNDTKTLTLNGVDFKSSAEVGLQFDGRVTIAVNGTNKITMEGETVKSALYNSNMGQGSFEIAGYRSTLVISAKNTSTTAATSATAIDATDVVIGQITMGYSVSVYVVSTGIGIDAATVTANTYATLEVYSNYVGIVTDQLTASYAKVEIVASGKALDTDNEPVFNNLIVGASITADAEKPTDEFDYDKIESYRLIIAFGTAIVFDNNGGSGEMNNMYVIQEFTLPECEFTQSGYKFRSWSVNGVSGYKPGSTCTVMPGTTTVTANWESTGEGPVADAFVMAFIIGLILIGIAIAIGVWMYSKKPKIEEDYE